MSCTDKNTMVFVVLEGEITVILHTTQFNAKKGDSFYIPPKVGVLSASLIELLLTICIL